MQNIVITGAAGFIGSALANNLSTNNESRIILIDSLEYGNVKNLKKELRESLIVTNCLNLNLLEEIIPNESVIFHFAGISSLPECESNYTSSINNIFNSTVNVYEIGVKKNMKKFIFASTSAVYENNNNYPFKEDFHVSPDLMYSYSKKISEDYLKFRALKLDLQNTYILRFFNVFGYNQDAVRKTPPLTAYLIDCLINNKTAHIYNDNPKIKRDYIFIDDLIEVFHYIIKSKINPKLELLNISSGNSYSVEEIISILNQLTSKKLKL